MEMLSLKSAEELMLECATFGVTSKIRKNYKRVYKALVKARHHQERRIIKHKSIAKYHVSETVKRNEAIIKRDITNETKD